MRVWVWVFTFKEGVLARVAHDLRLSVREVEGSLIGGRVSAKLQVKSLVVDGVAHGDEVDHGALSEHDRRKIQETIATEVLRTDVHPQVSFEGSARVIDARHIRIEGRLSLRGVSQPCDLELRASGDGELIGETTFAPSRFGIAPYKALAGAIRVADRVKVRVAIDLEGAAANALAAGSTTTSFSSPP